MMAEATNLHKSIGGMLATPWRRGVLAEGYAKNSRLDDAQKELKGAIDAADQTGGHFFDAELSRIAGEIELCSDPPGPAGCGKKFSQSDCGRKAAGG